MIQKSGKVGPRIFRIGDHDFRLDQYMLWSRFRDRTANLKASVNFRNVTNMEGPPDPRIIPSIPSKNAQQNAHAFVGATIALHALAFVVFAGRIWSRSNPVLRMYLDDYVCIVAYVCEKRYCMYRTD
jgi:hypothetical protein